MSITFKSRTSLSLLALAVVAAGAVAIPLQAQTSADAAADMVPGMQLFDRADADGDGAVTAAEWQAFVEARRAMTPEARRAEQAQIRAGRMIAMLDTDGDALLSADELAAAPMSGARHEGRGGDRDGMRGHGRMGSEHGGRDHNRGGRGHDGHGSRGEMFGMNRAPAGMPDAASIMARIDADSDGMVSLEELTAAMETMRERGPMGFFGGNR